MHSKLIRLDEGLLYQHCILAYGHFSTIHPGHVRYLKHARGLGERLVIALIGDNSSQNYPYKQNERAEALGLLGIADAVLLLDSERLEEAIVRLKPSVLVLGNEFKERSETGPILRLQEKQGGLIQFHAGDITYASTDLLSGSERDLSDKRRRQFRNACRRQNIDEGKILSAVKDWKNASLIVLGDTIVDQYAACEAIGMSAEAPVVVVRELEKKNFIGGAGVVAAHIRGLGARCNLVSVVGTDETADVVRDCLKQQGVTTALVSDSSRPTTFKKRYIVENQKLFRVSRLEDHNLDIEIEDRVIEQLERLAPDSSGIVVSDFVYGVVTPRILQVIHDLARKFNLMLIGDLQCSSQVGSITRFRNFSLLCPNEREARLALQDKESGLEQLSQRLVQLTKTEQLVMKLGSDGFIAYERLASGEFNSQAFPALSVNPVDVAGAGDSLLAVFAAGLASGQRIMDIAALACCMASLAVETMGNTPINADSLQRRLQEVLRS